MKRKSIKSVEEFAGISVIGRQNPFSEELVVSSVAGRKKPCSLKETFDDCVDGCVKRKPIKSMNIVEEKVDSSNISI